jgi:hypothetical protein
VFVCIGKLRLPYIPPRRKLDPLDTEGDAVAPVVGPVAALKAFAKALPAAPNTCGVCDFCDTSTERIATPTIATAIVTIPSTSVFILVYSEYVILAVFFVRLRPPIRLEIFMRAYRPTVEIIILQPAFFTNHNHFHSPIFLRSIGAKPG